MRLIDADALKGRFRKRLQHYEYREDDYGIGRCGGMTDAMEMIDNAPTIAAIPVVHGRWMNIPDKPEWDQKMCSICGDHFCCQVNYCPNCGAKMDGDADG